MNAVHKEIMELRNFDLKLLIEKAEDLFPREMKQLRYEKKHNRSMRDALLALTDEQLAEVMGAE